MNRKFFVLLVLSMALVLLTVAPLTVNATHAWGNYHWERSSNPISLGLGDNVSGVWDAHLDTAASDWNQSSVLDVSVTNGRARGQCRPQSGRIEVCNDAYGNNGWLGLAQIWASGDHITQGAAKVNDTYFGSAPYNTDAWRNLVMCQEIGHVFGLGHTDENFDNPPDGTCMDYSSDPVPNQHPNAHDYAQLEIIYGHLDGGGGGGNDDGGCNPRRPNCPGGNNSAMGGEFNTPSEWGQLVRDEGRTAVYVRDFGNGQQLVTFVIWAD